MIKNRKRHGALLDIWMHTGDIITFYLLVLGSNDLDIQDAFNGLRYNTNENIESSADSIHP